MDSAPSTHHQTVSRRLQHQLYTQVELTGQGVISNAPVDVRLTDHDLVQPDLVVVLSALMQMITPTKIKGVPDLVVEILSPSTASNDATLKKQQGVAVRLADVW